MIIVFGGLIWIGFVRIVAIWTTDSWHYLSIYYISTFILMGLSFFAVSVRYMKDKGYLQRFELNKKKWNGYTELVTEKYNLRWNFLLSRFFVFFLFIECLFTNFYRDNHIGESLSNLLNFVFVLLFFFLFVNQIYIYICMKQTPIPIRFVGEPPRFYLRLASSKYTGKVFKVFLREYGTGAGVVGWRYKKGLAALGIATGSLIFTTMGVDRCWADYTGETSYIGQAFTASNSGWYTKDPLTKQYAHKLSQWGVNPAQFAHKHSKLLDVELVAKRYKEIDTARNPLPIPAQLAELVEKAELRMLEQEKRHSLEIEKMLESERKHSLEIEKLNNEMAKLKKDVSLENSKEIDLN